MGQQPARLPSPGRKRPALAALALLLGVNQLGSLVVGSVTDPLNPDNPVGVAQVVVDVIGRLQ